MQAGSSLSLAPNSRYCYSFPPLYASRFYLNATKTSIHAAKVLSSISASDNQNPSERWNHRTPKPSVPQWLDKSLSPSAAPVSKIVEKAVERRGGNGSRPSESDLEARARYLEQDKGQSAMERIVLRLQNLGFGSTGEEAEGAEGEDSRIDVGDLTPVTGDERLGDLLRRDWVRPDVMLNARERSDDDDDDVEMLLPWEKNDGDEVTVKESERGENGVSRRRAVRAPSLAELTIEDSELRRLRRDGMYLRERINIPKAGLTQEVMEKIYDKWRKDELVRLKFHEILARDMKTAHEIVERRTGGLVIWRAGSVMVVYRGNNYEGPFSRSERIDRSRETLFVPDVSCARNSATNNEKFAESNLQKREPVVNNAAHVKNMTEEEAEFNSLLDQFGPRFHEWWGTGILPVDADLLPPKIPGYKTPLRLLPTGMRSRLTNAEIMDLRKIAKTLPCHFALGRNRNHQGLAAAIIKLWEKTLVVKIAVKRGIQNTNNKLMADELKNLTGGSLLLRNKYYIVIYRGKDFLPSSVASTLSERQELTKEIQDVEERVRSQGFKAEQPVGDEVQAQAGTLAEFYEAQARWGRQISVNEHEKMIKEASKADHDRIVRRIEHKLDLAQGKKHRAEKLLSRIESSMLPSGPDYDQETISDEERAMFRRVGLRMKAYLPLGIRGVFDGVIENMHLHWKHRELVKLLSKQKTLAFVEDAARLLEYESGGVLVAIEKVPQGFALIYYRGKNYQRPFSLRPRNLLNKAKALKRTVALQRHENLSQHIDDLESTIQQMNKDLNGDEHSYTESDGCSNDEKEEID